MSFPTLCDGCAFGKHDQHQDWTGPAGVIGGTSCECAGECQEVEPWILAAIRMPPVPRRTLSDG